MKKQTILAIILIAAIALIAVLIFWIGSGTESIKQTDQQQNQQPATFADEENTNNETNEKISQPEQTHPMDIEALRTRKYPGGDFVIEQELENGTNYRQFVASYQSEGLKIYGLLTEPLALRPGNGYPAVVFVHGHIPPERYSTTEDYPTYQATLARGGFVTFKPDLRGHGNSEGEPASAHFSEKYLVDVMYAISYLKNYSAVDPDRIGYWGHSNGAETGLRTVVISSDIKATVFWAGVVGSFEDHLETHNSKIPFMRNPERNELVREYGLPSENLEFWSKIDPYNFLGDITIPIQLHHGVNDHSVPLELSVHLKEELENAGKEVELYEYPGDDHNIEANSSLAWQRSIEFFRENL